jgi:hypothetical protein
MEFQTLKKAIQWFIKRALIKRLLFALLQTLSIKLKRLTGFDTNNKLIPLSSGNLAGSLSLFSLQTHRPGRILV